MTSITPPQPARSTDIAPTVRHGQKLLTRATVRQQVGEQLVTMPGRENQVSRTANELLELSPEEVDADSTRDPDDPNDPDDIQNPFSTRRPADIIFEPRMARRAPRLPVVTHVSRRQHRDLGVKVRSADPTRVIEESDALHADLYEARLESLAEVLLQRQYAALSAPTLPQAFFELLPLTQAEHAEAAGLVDGPWLSKRNGLLVSCSWGTMPIEFFWWRRPDMADDVLRAAHRLPRILASDSTLGPLPAARRALEEIGTTDALYADSVRQLVPAVRAVRKHRHLIEAQRANLPDVDDIHVRDMIADAEPNLNKSRLLTIVRIAIVGAFDQEWR